MIDLRLSSSVPARGVTVVIGSGPGGYVAAIRLGQLGKNVVLVEKNKLGGVCVNVGCIPSKALISASKLVKNARNASRMGIDAQVNVDLERLQQWKQSVVDRLAGGIAQLCKTNKVNVVYGEAKFLTANSVNVATQDSSSTLEFENAIIATGSSQTEPPGVKVDGDRIISSTEALSLRKAPAKLLVLGGGAVGLEIGMAYANLFGTELIIVELMDQLLPGVDPDLVAFVSKSLHRLNAKVHLRSKLARAEANSGGVSVVIETPQGEVRENTEYVLVATGRRPNSSNLGLEQLGVELNPKGFVHVDKKQRTNIGNIFAIGDVVGGPLLAHKAFKEGIVAAEVIAGIDSSFDSSVIPSAIFTDPEIATVGFSPSEIAQKKIQSITGKFPFIANGKALASGEPEGFVKVIADKESNEILGFEMVGNESSDLISEGALAIELGASLEDFTTTIHPHPTLPEAVLESVENALGKAIHIQNRAREV